LLNSLHHFSFLERKKKWDWWICSTKSWFKPKLIT